GGTVNGQPGVALIDIKELQPNGCAGITNSLTVLFTASHANLGGVSVDMIGPGGPYNFTLPTPVPETGDWYDTAAPSGWSLGTLTPCAYIVTLSVSLLLTTGDSDPLPLIDQIAFCLSG
ncbi:MAG: carboxypeptidase-like regulatory domain-containing protein, partial [Chloroflexota bacterium]